MNQRLRNLLIVFGLAHQLSVWLKHLTDMGDVTRDCKYSSKVLKDMCDRFIEKYGATDDMIYEHSVQISELFESIAKMDEKDINRVMRIITDIENQRNRR